jgi:hypothetical protein
VPYFFGAALAGAALAGAAFAAGAALAAGAAAGAASAAAAAGSSSARAILAMATARSCSLPRRSSGITTPAGSLMSDRCTMSPIFNAPRSTSMNSGRSFGRQEIVTSLSSCVMTEPASLPAGEVVWLTKCSGTRTRIASFSDTRWKSRCRICGLNGWRCMSRSRTRCVLPSMFRSRIAE